MTSIVHTGDCLAILPTLPEQSVHCVVTSPPYWGLRDYGVDGQLGLEQTPDEYVANMVAVFRAVWRVLRDDGTCWVNMGDSYARDGGSGPGGGNRELLHMEGVQMRNCTAPPGLKPKDLVGIPWRLAFALQADGWYLRDAVIWHKPGPMPFSGKDRCCPSYEFMFQLTKKAQYYYDWFAISEPCVTDPSEDGRRRKRNVWTIASGGFKAKHFAVFPQRLVEPCIMAGTSEKGCCPSCGAPWRRIVEKDRKPTRPGRDSKVYADPEGSPYEQHAGSIIGNRDPKRHTTETRTVGWEPGCECCDYEGPVAPIAPALVADIFCGSGTVGVVCRKSGRNFVGIELNPEYAEMARQRIANPEPEPEVAEVEGQEMLFDGVAP